jgi:hypothetical protein
MGDPLEAAAVSRGTLLYGMAHELDNGIRAGSFLWRANESRRLLFAGLREAVGCETCNGMGRQLVEYMPTADRWEDCPADHAEIVVWGETIWADPAKCEWICRRIEGGRCLPGTAGRAVIREEWYDKMHQNCGWQPRLDLILGGS